MAKTETWIVEHENSGPGAVLYKEASTTNLWLNNRDLKIIGLLRSPENVEYAGERYERKRMGYSRSVGMTVTASVRTRTRRRSPMTPTLLGHYYFWQIQRLSPQEALQNSGLAHLWLAWLTIRDNGCSMKVSRCSVVVCDYLRCCEEYGLIMPLSPPQRPIKLAALIQE